MNSDRNIFFPTDFSDDSLNILPYAIDYAEKGNAVLVIIHVIESPHKISEKLKILMGENNSDIKEIDSAASFLLNEISNRIKKSYEIKVQHKILYGNLLNALLAYINKVEPEMIVLSAKSNNKAYKIADYSPIAAITINAKTLFKEIKKILFPINNKQYTRQKIEEIIRISSIYKAEVVLLGVTSDSCDGFDNMSKHMEEIYEKLHSRGVTTTLKIVIGNDYTDEINNYSEHHNIDLISVVSNFEHGILSLFKKTPDEILVKSSTIPILNIPIEIEIYPTSEISAEYISPWSMKYDTNMILFPFK